MNDFLLLEALKLQRKNSIETLIRKYSAYTSTVVFNQIGSTASREDIEEVVQDVFMAVWNNAENITSLKAYIGTTARNMALNKLRSISKSDLLDDNLTDTRYQPQQTVEKKEVTQVLYEAIEALGEPDCEIFFRFYYNNEKIKDIAFELGINTSTVKSKLKRGKEKLSAYLSERRDLL